ncbi:MAG: CAAX prenyl protease-related protein [Verrucomicrobiota bacterium]
MRDLIKSPAFPYVAPFILFLIIFLMLGGIHDLAKYFLHPISVLVVGGTLWFHRKVYPKIEIKRPVETIALGLLGTVLWIYLFVVPEDTSEGFNPFKEFSQPLAIFFLISRLIGFALVTPFMEEIFWRGFLMRILIKEDDRSLKEKDWRELPLGQYGHFSFWATTVLFVFAHATAQETVASISFALLAGGWFLKTKSLGDVILLHAVTNLSLAGYVLVTQKWYFW